MHFFVIGLVLNTTPSVLQPRSICSTFLTFCKKIFANAGHCEIESLQRHHLRHVDHCQFLVQAWDKFSASLPLQASNHRANICLLPRIVQRITGDERPGVGGAMFSTPDPTPAADLDPLPARRRRAGM
jgi:hypothetical protein